MPPRPRPIATIAVVLLFAAVQLFAAGLLRAIKAGMALLRHQPLHGRPTPPALFLVLVSAVYTAFLIVAWRRGHVSFAGTWIGCAAWTLVAPIALLIYGSIPWSIEGSVLLHRVLPDLAWFDRKPYNFAAHPIISVAMICLMAPIFEELIFRGWVLAGLLRTTTPARAILITTVLFAAFHINPFQFPVALIVGGISGWIYYRTRSVVLCMVAHALNNSVVALAGLRAHAVVPRAAHTLVPDLWLGVGLVAMLGGAVWFEYRAPALPAPPAPSGQGPNAQPLTG